MAILPEAVCRVMATSFEQKVIQRVADAGEDLADDGQPFLLRPQQPEHKVLTASRCPCCTFVGCQSREQSQAAGHIRARCSKMTVMTTERKSARAGTSDGCAGLRWDLGLVLHTCPCSEIASRHGHLHRGEGRAHEPEWRLCRGAARAVPLLPAAQQLRRQARVESRLLGFASPSLDRQMVCNRRGRSFYSRRGGLCGSNSRPAAAKVQLLCGAPVPASNCGVLTVPLH